MDAVHGFGPTGQSKGGDGLCSPCIIPIGAAESHEGPSDGWALPEPQLSLHQLILFGHGISLFLLSRRIALEPGCQGAEGTNSP